MKSTRLKVLDGLRYGPMNPYDLATMIDVAPFNVRGELGAMKREGLVDEHRTRERHAFELTTRGRDVLQEAQQIRLEGVG